MDPESGRPSWAAERQELREKLKISKVAAALPDRPVHHFNFQDWLYKGNRELRDVLQVLKKAELSLSEGIIDDLVRQAVKKTTFGSHFGHETADKHLILCHQKKINELEGQIKALQKQKTQLHEQVDYLQARSCRKASPETKDESDDSSEAGTLSDFEQTSHKRKATTDELCALNFMPDKKSRLSYAEQYEFELPTVMEPFQDDPNPDDFADLEDVPCLPPTITDAGQFVICHSEHVDWYIKTRAFYADFPGWVEQYV